MFKYLAFNLYSFLFPSHWGLKFLGSNSILISPFRIEGKPYISIGQNTIVTKGAWISVYSLGEGGVSTDVAKISIGNHVRIGPNVMITAVDSVTVGDGCLLSKDVYISDHTHGSSPGCTPPHRQPLIPKGSVSIGRNCFIGVRAAIMPGVTLGDYCIVGANAVVTRSFPSYSIVAGVPARLIGCTDSGKGQEESVQI